MLGLHPNALFTSHVGQKGGRGLSPRLWSFVNGQAMSPDGFSNAMQIADDFMNFGPSMAVAANVGYYASEGGMYKSYEDNGGSIAQLATVNGGAIKLATDNTDNDEVSIVGGCGAGAWANITPTAGSEKLTIFETRFQVAQIANTYNLFIGLAEAGVAASDFIGDTGAMADKDLLGFRIAEADGDTLTFVQQNEGDGIAIATKIADVGTLVADTWYKAGFVYDPTAPASKRIRVFFDNEENATTISSTDMALASFPDKKLVYAAAIQSASGAIKSVTLDWYAFWQAG